MSPAAPPDPTRTAGPSPGSAPLVFLVDDDIDFLDGMRPLLTGENFRVETCSRPRRAFRLIRRLKPSVVILDQDMPDRSGLEILDQLRSSSATLRIPIVLLTAQDEQDLRLAGFESGLDDFIAKPFHGGELSLRLRAVLRRSERSDEFSGGSEESLDRALQASGRAGIHVLHLPGFEELRRGEEKELVARYEETRALLLHRLRDRFARERGLGPGEIHVQRRGKGTTLIAFSPGRKEPRDTRPALERLLGAANRLVRRAWKEESFLAPGESGGLRRLPMPRFVLLAVENPLGRSLTGRELFEILALELEQPLGPGEAFECCRKITI